MKVTIEAMSFSKMECFFEDVILKQGKEADTTNAVSKAVQKFCRKYRGEGAGVYSRLIELNISNAFSCKFSEGANGLTDMTGQYKFANMRAYLFWAVRDWLNPKNKCNAAIPPCEKFMEEATNIRWFFQSNGSIMIEPKEKIKQRIKRSPDFFDSLANTFYPHDISNFDCEDLLSNLL